MLELFLVAAFSLIVSGLGWSLVMRLDGRGKLSNGERIGLSFLVGCLVVYLGVAFIGPWQLDSISMSALATALLAMSIPGLRSIPWYGFANSIGAELTTWRSDKWSGLLWIIAAIIGLSAIIQGLAPPNDYDSLLYHLALPRFDVDLGYMDVPWDRSILQILMPAFGGNLTRFVLPFSGDGTAQAIHGLFGLVAALGTALLVRHFDYGKATALLAAIMFLSIRAVVWEMATAETDVLLAASTIFSLLVYLKWRETPSAGHGILFGLLIGISILVKLQGFVIAAAIAPLIIYDLFQNRRNTLQALIGPLVAFIVITPHLLKTYYLTGNPLFPMFNLVFNPGTRDLMTGFNSIYGTGNGVFDLLISPWVVSIMPMHYFDGMVLGAPYLLALCPLALLTPNKRRLLPVLSVVTVYYVFWFYTLSQQVRFLIHVGPVFAALAAVGAAQLWQETLSSVVLKRFFLAVVLVLSLNQAAFVGIYAAIRLPAAVGLMNAEEFHERTPTMTGAHYKTCSFIANNLKAGERYFSEAIGFVSYYCPQAAAVRNYFPDEAKWWLKRDAPPEMSRQDFIKNAEKMNIRFFMTSENFESRRNISGKSVIVNRAASRVSAYLQPAYKSLEPLIKGKFTAVYDGPEVIKALKELAD